MSKIKEDVHVRIEKRRNKRHARVARLRWLKNLVWWFSGVLSGIIILVGVIALLAFSMPVRNIANLAGVDKEELDGYISEKISNQSIANALASIGDNTLADIPVLADAILGLIGNDIYNYSYVKEGVEEFSDAAKSGDYFYKKHTYAKAFETDGSYMAGVDEYTKLYVENGEEFEIYNGSIATFSDQALSGKYFYRSGTTLEKAFNEDGSFVSSKLIGTPLYKKSSLEVLKVGDAVSALLGRVSTAAITDLFDAVGIGNLVTEDSPLFDVLSGKRPDDFTSMDVGAEINKIGLYKVLEDYNDNNKELYDILCGALGKENAQEQYREVTIGDLSNGSLEIGRVKLSVIMELPYSKDEAGNVVYGEDDKPVIDEKHENYKLYTMVFDVVKGDKLDEENNVVRTVDDFEDIIIDDFIGFDTDDVSLSNLLSTPYKDDGEGGQVVDKNHQNYKLYSMLLDATKGKQIAGADTPDDLTDDKYIEKYEDITLKTMSGFNPDRIKLSTVLDSGNPDNATLFSVLFDVTKGKQIEGVDTPDDLTDDLFITAIDDITVGSLEGFDANKIHLTSILKKDTGDTVKDEQTAKLYNILNDATGLADADITIGDMSSFNTDNIKLSTVVEYGSNKIINKLLERTGDDAVTIGTLATDINELDIAQIYGKECFVKPTTIDDSKARYSTSDDGATFVIDANGEYQISTEASVWLFIMYKVDSVSGYDANGNALKYTKQAMQLQNISDAIAGVSGDVMDATVRQCIDAGIISENPLSPYHSSMYAMTIGGVIDTLSGYLYGSI